MAHSIIGYHFSTGGTKTGIGAWIDNANSKGITVGLKGVSDYGLLFEATQKGNQYGVDNWLVYRMSKAAGTISRETPTYTANPFDDARALCDEAISKLPPEFDKSKVWLELLNEPRGKWTDEPVWSGYHPVDYLGVWCHAAAVYLNDKGYKFCGPGFNSGEPGDDGKPLSDAVAQYSQPGMVNYLAYCADNPDIAALATHEYIWDLPAPQYPHLWGRFEGAIAAADLAGIPRTFPIMVTEWGYSPSNAPTYPAVIPDLDKYNQIAAKFPQVKFAAAWTLQSGYSPVDTQVLSWINYPIDKQFDPGPQPAATAVEFGSTLPGNEEPPMSDDIRGFEIGWETLTDRLQQPNGFTLQVLSPNTPLWYQAGGPGKATGTVEAKHLICGQTLPANQCVGGSDPLALDGLNTYKMQAVNMATGTSLRTVFEGDGRKQITVPVRVHWQQDQPNEADDVFVAVLMNGSLVKLLQHPELQDRTWHYITGEADGPVEVELRFQTSYANSRDCFTDRWVPVDILEPPDPPPPPPADCEGLPRVQYTRRYNVIPAGATEQQAVDIFLEGWRRSKETAGGSYDDAGLGDLDNKVANLYGIADIQQQTFIDWFNLHYPGTVVNFLAVPGGEPTPGPFDWIWPVTNSFHNVNAPFGQLRDYDGDGEYSDRHEGTDLYARPGDYIIASKGGVVSWASDKRQTDGQPSAYGWHVKINHEGELYQSWYCHLAAVSVQAGQVVGQGDVLGPAGSTGNSTGVHLHMNIRKQGHYAGSGYAPSDVIDPVPLLDAPAPSTYQYNGPAVTLSPALHAPGSDWEWAKPEVQSLYNQLNIPVKFMSDGVSSNYYQQFNKPQFHLVRVFWKATAAKTPAQAWSDDIKDGVLAMYSKGARKFELLNEPNLAQEGAGSVWTADTLGEWLKGLAVIIRANCPDAKLYFPGMSPGVPWTNQFEWINKAWPVVKSLCSGFALHAYTGIVDSQTAAVDDIVNQVKEAQAYLNLQVPLVVSECSVNRAASAGYKAAVYKAVENKLKVMPGIEAVCWYISSWELAGPEAVNQESWVANGIGNAYAAL